MRFADVRRTTAFRLVALMGLASLAAVVLLLGLIYGLTARELTLRTDDLLGRELQRFRPPAGMIDAAHVRTAMATGNGFDHFALVDAHGRLVTGSFAPPGLAARASGWLALPDGTPLRYVAIPAAGGGRLFVGRDATQIENLRRRVLAILAASGAATVVAVMAAAVLLSLAPLRRIHLLTTIAGRISAGDLAQRMPVSPRGDELDRIAATINLMIEDIAHLLDQVKGATDAIAHDLRAPIAAVHTRLVALRRADGGAAGALSPAVSDVVDTALDELDLVLARFGALLRIAEYEASGRQAGFATVDLMALAAHVCELYEPLAEERGIALGLSGGWGHVVHGDERLLFEALSNLVENAVKFGAPGGHVVVIVDAADGIPAITIRDDGPGIPAQERARVVRRFVRGADVRHIPGSGLGLSLVAAIVRLHGFTMAMRDAEPGLEVVILCQTGDDIK